MKTITIAALAAAAAAAGQAAAAGAADLDVFVSIAPQRYFVERIAGERADVHVMVPPGAHPAVYEPSPRQMTALFSADIYFAVGVPFEAAWMDKIRAANPGLKIVHTDAWIQKRPIEAGTGEAGHGAKPDHEGDAHEHARGAPDPHVWLSPPLVMIQARHILAGLCAADPGHAAEYEANYKAFLGELADLDAELRRMFTAVPAGRQFLVFHPSWGYFADTYGLVQVAVETGGKSPKAAELQRLVTLARQKGIRAVLVQPQVSTRTAEIIARETGGKTVTADPLAENWAKNLVSVAGKILEAAR